MTIKKDNLGKRKPSWESKISVCTASTRPVGRSERSDTPSSILSSDSDIRFTRKLGGQYRCGCCIVAGFLLFLLVAAVAVYLAYTFLISRSRDERVFRVNFRVTEGDTFHPKLANPSTEEFRVRARDYRERLNLIFRRSDLRPAFLKTEVLALDGNQGRDLVVHFNVHFDGRRMPVEVEDLDRVLRREIQLEQSLYLANLTIPVDSLLVRQSDVDMTTHLAVSTSNSSPPPSTTPRPPRTCTPLQLSYCSKLGHNVTSYPNMLGHQDYTDVQNDVIAFREIVDSECYRLSYEFVCQILQPPCQKSAMGEDRMVLPCRNFCNDFIKHCGSRLPPRLTELIECSKFPEMKEDGACLAKPGCVEELQGSGLESRLCDGVVDCVDMSDETSCSYCQEGHLHCGVGRFCVPKAKLCDGVADCPNGSDENNCLAVAPSLANTDSRSLSRHHYHSEGYVVFSEDGRTGKLCADNLNTTEADPTESLKGLADSLCRSIAFEKATHFRIQRDDEETNKQYVEMEDETTFSQTSCPGRKVLHLGCAGMNCGVQALRPKPGVQGLNKMAVHGDWPWHVALLKDHVHLCDGTLVSSEWLITTASCFQGQSKAEWVARVGGVRLSSYTPWEQERRIVGMVKSPIEGSTLVLLRLNEPVAYSDFVRPVCLPDLGTNLDNLTHCNTLGWSRNKEQLQRVDVKIIHMAKCENISILTENSICTETAYTAKDCNDEEFAGSPLVCLKPGGSRWTLAGVSNWRIGCQLTGTERPRLYDKTASNIEWITQTIAVTAA